VHQFETAMRSDHLPSFSAVWLPARDTHWSFPESRHLVEFRRILFVLYFNQFLIEFDHLNGRIIALALIRFDGSSITELYAW
jgi:hypothetical protein